METNCVLIVGMVLGWLLFTYQDLAICIFGVGFKIEYPSCAFGECLLFSLIISDEYSHLVCTMSQVKWLT